MVDAFVDTEVREDAAAGQPQKIVVFQQNGSGETKIQGIRRFGGDSFLLEIISIDAAVPPIVDDPEKYLPESIEGDLVLDYLRHPDLSYELAKRCAALNIPVVASGKKLEVREAITPLTCCALSRHAGLGRYGEQFGAPDYEVVLDSRGCIESVRVLRGAPCGASWDAGERIVGLPAEDATIRIGLETQFFCTANPAGWDPLYGKSPVHFAGEVHKNALKRAIEACNRGNEGLRAATGR